MARSGRDSGGDLFDMAQKGTKVPEDAAEPRYIPSKPRPDQIASETDRNALGGRTLAEAATNEGDIPRSTRDTAINDVLTGTGDSLPTQVDSKRLHSVPGGVTHDPFAKGSTRMTEHKVQSSDYVQGASEGPRTDRAPGQEGLSEEQVTDKIERRG
ncbi:uncharacterized protein Z519_02502 [Cladophialophora bantiana CBS 173.52]|uniref:SMP domain-containing protein n=1 Tax=Cladophialophora bantiana (strain ATCC 10958 / CBS 173.52 / CDC B-1940 / NIH 8579) TaxID=1442370 RepID=A0A0D2I1S0_CLAB1|nr:uncharacterized protein Z519_02502 [Cladophialophora bantiana CBS 173.52]KIW97110.1 hypothetical protein Z519_02502 [Cladophialophora bantiana CBS 173.52]